MTIEEMKNKLKEQMTIHNVVHDRFYHSLGVSETAVLLNNKFHMGLDNTRLEISGILHDCAKLLPKDVLKEYTKMDLNIHPCEVAYEEILFYPSLWHSFAGAVVANKDYGVQDELILDAIRYHTTGRKSMNDYEKLIYISDFIEPNRKESIFSSCRELSFKSLNKGVLEATVDTISYLIENKYPICKLTIDTYNDLIIKMSKEDS